MDWNERVYKKLISTLKARSKHCETWKGGWEATRFNSTKTLNQSLGCWNRILGANGVEGH